MILADKDIKKALKSGRIKIKPLPDLAKQLGSCSLDFRLGDTFRVFDYNKVPFLDTRKKRNALEITTEVKVKRGEYFVLHPGDLVLATTIEYLELADDILGRLEGRSSLGRVGVIVHSTAAVFDPGWRGKIAMELGNLGRIPVTLYPGMRICAMTFEEVSCRVDVPYWQKKGAKYLNQKGPEPSKLFMEEADGKVG